ncbi:MAG: membrane-bound PQQ-dependent dehydrogenase, glucose/quinate/shikimate family [Pseudohongiella sp.]|nr:membrane-bound PQQ-dependent dehydrogenase, glucose/quinate/shikimate family [Pseudohongiella sp.]
MFFVLFGLPLVVGGVWLIAIGGSWYYLPAGIAFVISGALFMLGRRLGAALYGALFVVTVLWSLYEVGLNGWALMPRVFGLSILLLLVLAALPVLQPARPARRFVLIGLGAFVVVVGTIGVLVVTAGRPTMHNAVPVASTTSSNPEAVAADWPAYGGTYAAQRYSSLDQINPDNVSQLTRVWEYRTGDLPEERWGAETTPLKIGDAVYLCSARNILIALDARTGSERWRHDPVIPDENIPYTAACRGVAYFASAGSQACPTRVIEGTLDARLIAVNAQSGEPCTDFGDNGYVDTTRGMGSVAPGMVSMTSPPTIVQGVVVVGHQILDGERRDAPSGVIKGFDAVSGEMLWAWDMARPDLSGMPPTGETYTRGTPNMWTIASGDEQLGLVYLPMGNSAADYYSGTRTPPENQYASALVALDVTTGRPAWHFQTVYMDVWDYDLGSQATLVDFPTPAGPVPALLLPSKQGEIYVLDRRSGEPLTGVEERPVPTGGVEPEQRTATQPFSLYHTLRRPDVRERDMWGMSPIDQMICRIQFRAATYDGIYTPPTTETRWIQYPGYNGGSDWGGVSVDPQRGVIIANYNDMPNYNRLVPREEANERGWFPRDDPRNPEADSGGNPEGQGAPQIGVPFAVDVNAGWRMPVTGLLCKQPPWGGIRAIDLRSGETLWDRPFGSARANGPFGIPSMLPFEIGTPNNAGSVITAGGLIFIAAATDNLIRAIDIDTGRTVWQDVLPAGGQATPMVYEMDGRQYLVITAAGHHFMETPVGDYVIAYALPEID